MSYEVLVENLRSAAGSYRAVAADLGTTAVEVTNAKPGSMGHVELAAWIEAVADQCAKANAALHDGATGLGESLESAASHYEITDDQVGQAFRLPFTSGGLLLPGGGR